MFVTPFDRVRNSPLPGLPIAVALTLALVFAGACAGNHSGPSAAGTGGKAGPQEPIANVIKKPAPKPSQTPTRFTDDDGQSFDVERIDSTHVLVSHEVLLQIVMDASTGALPLEHNAYGYRVTDAPAKSLLAALDIKAGDQVLDIDGAPLASATDARRAFIKVRSKGRFTLAVRRAGKRMEQTYILRAAINEWMGMYVHLMSLAGLRGLDDELGAMVDALQTGVRERAPGHYDIDPEILRMFKNDAELFARTSTAPGKHFDGMYPGADKNPFRVLHLSPYYLIKRVAGKKMEDLGDLEAAVRDLEGQADFSIEATLLDKKITLRYSAVDGLLDRDKLAKAQIAWTEWTKFATNNRIDLNLPPLGSTGSPQGQTTTGQTTTGQNTQTGSATAKLPVAELDQNITKVSVFEYEIKRALLDRMLDDPELLASGARVVPSVRHGRANGFKLYAIRPTSALARLGFKNGDTVISINGTRITTPDSVLGVTDELRKTDNITIGLRRRGRVRELKHKVVP